MAKKKKLGRSADIVIGKKTYTSENMPNAKSNKNGGGGGNSGGSGHQKNVQSNVKRGSETSPKTVISNKTPNVGYKIPKSATGGIKTDVNASTNSKPKVQTTKNVTVGSEQHKNVQSNVKKGSENSSTPQTVISNKTPTSVKSGIKTDIGTPTSSKSKVQTTKNVTVGSEPQKKVKSNIKRESVLSITPQTIIRNKTPNVGYKTPTSVKSGIKTDIGTSTSLKSKVQTTKNVTVGSEPQKKVQSNIQRESSISVTPQTVIRNKTPNVGYKIPTSTKNGIMTDVRNKTQTALSSQGDSGSSAISTAISMGVISVKSYKLSKTVTPHIIKGTYNVASRTYRVVRALDRDIASVMWTKGGTAMVGKRVLNDFKNTKPVHGIIHAVGGVKTAVKTAKKYSLEVGYGVYKNVKVAKGILNGSVKVQINKNTLNSFKNKAIVGLKKHFTGKELGYKIRTGVKTGLKTSFKSAKIVSRINARAFAGVSNVLSNSDDSGLQTLGLGFKLAHYTVKGAKTTPKLVKTSYRGIKTGAKGILKTGKVIGNTPKKIHKNAKAIKKVYKAIGKRRATKQYLNKLRNKTAKLIANSGKSIVSAIIKVVGGALQSSVLPLILIVLLVGAIFIATSGGIGGVLSAFAGVATNKDTGADVEEIPYLTSKINASRLQFVQDIKELRRVNLVENGGYYHYVRLFNPFNDTEMVLSDTNILNSILSTPQYLEYIQPVFHTILLSSYNLEATESQMDSLYQEMWEALTDVTQQVLPIEYCANAHTCGSRHANTATCPNFVSGTHSTYTCPTCCYYYYICKGHKGSLNCGKTAHSHSSSCYTPVLTCSKEEHTHTSCYSYIRTCTVAHVHNSNCYFKKLVCTQSHTHTASDACTASILNCSQNHAHTNACFTYINYCFNANHTHHPSCYNAYLSCTNTLYTHGHTASCYTRLSTMNCDMTAHSHTGGCYTSTLTCGMEEHSHTEWTSASHSGCYNTTYHSGNLSSDCGNSTRYSACNGYNYCNGHRVLGIIISTKGMGELLDTYFLDEITLLENKPSLTNAEKDKLDDLRSSYEICQAVIEVMSADLGTTDGNIAGLEDVTLTDLTEYACTFIGNRYVWGGTDPNTGADCSGFVKYVFAHFGISLPRTSREQVTCGNLVSGIDNAVAGDLIFWSENGTDGGVYHVAIYLGNGKIVHASNSQPYPQGGIKTSSVYGTIYKIKRIVN